MLMSMGVSSSVIPQATKSLLEIVNGHPIGCLSQGAAFSSNSTLTSGPTSGPLVRFIGPKKVPVSQDISKGGIATLTGMILDPSGMWGTLCVPLVRS